MFENVMERWAERFQTNRSAEFESDPEKYLFWYCEASFRYLKSFEYSRSRQFELAVNGPIENDLNSISEFQNRERQCVLALEAVYTYIHRIEKIVRPNSGKFDLSSRLDLPQTEAERWMNELRYMSEVRNKVIEHAPENLFSHPDWGQAFDISDPFEFRLWILVSDALERVQQDTTVSNEIEKAISAIGKHLPVVDESPFDKWLGINQGSGYLQASQINSLFKNALGKVGCITHSAVELAAKLSNLTTILVR